MRALTSCPPAVPVRDLAPRVEAPAGRWSQRRSIGSYVLLTEWNPSSSPESGFRRGLMEGEPHGSDTAFLRPSVGERKRAVGAQTPPKGDAHHPHAGEIVTSTLLC